MYLIKSNLEWTAVMPRPERVQYEHAFYHVMSRGRGRQLILHGKVYYEDFLETLVVKLGSYSLWVRCIKTAEEEL